MATRPVFVPLASYPYVKVIEVEFEWFPGFSVSQKQKSIRALHRAAILNHGLAGPLEISSKSLQPVGVALSAFNLMVRLPSRPQGVPVECVYQASKVFENGGPYTDLLTATPREAKRDDRLRTSGPLIGFLWSDCLCPIEPKTAFYDWVYLRALLENRPLSEPLTTYGFFSDIEFNPEKSVNCQAHSAALYVGLSQANRSIKRESTFHEYLELLTLHQPEPKEWRQGRLDF